MTILAADDESIALGVLVDAIKAAEPEATVVSFNNGKDVENYLTDNTCDICFLDIEMGDYNGIDLAIHAKNHNPKVNIIFVTGYSDYLKKAFEVRASGYIFKPATADKIKEELEHLRNPLEEDNSDEKVLVRTFGNFDIYNYGEPLTFKRSKSKELFAYLIDRKGAGVTKKEIASILFVDTPYERKIEDYINKIYREMVRSLKESGIDDVIVKKRNYYAIDPKKVKCDRYDFENGDAKAVKAYAGEYMRQYAWAEFHHAVK